MTDIDLSKYDGHTPGPWRIGQLESYNAETGEPEAFVYRLDPSDKRATAHNRICVRGAEGAMDCDADARLIADAPLLLAEVKRLLEEVGELRNGVCLNDPSKITTRQKKLLKEAADKLHRENVEAIKRLRQSHARLLAAIKADADIVEPDETLCWCCKPPEVDHYGHCAQLRAAVAEAEGLNGE